MVKGQRFSYMKSDDSPPYTGCVAFTGQWSRKVKARLFKLEDWEVQRHALASYPIDIVELSCQTLQFNELLPRFGYLDVVVNCIGGNSSCLDKKYLLAIIVYMVKHGNRAQGGLGRVQYDLKQVVKGLVLQICCNCLLFFFHESITYIIFLDVAHRIITCASVTRWWDC